MRSLFSSMPSRSVVFLIVILTPLSAAARGIVEAGLSREFHTSGPMVTVTRFPSLDTRCEPWCRAAGRNFNFDR